MTTHPSYSYLKNPMDGGTCRATVHRVAKSWTGLKRLSACTQETRALNHLLSNRVRFTMRSPHEQNLHSQDEHQVLGVLMWNRHF